MLRYEGRYERLFGIKTLQIKKSDDPDNFHYQGASYLVLFEVLKKLPETLKDKIFVDIGSGKGRALFCAEYIGFNNLLGVELDEELVKVANENIKLYLPKREKSNFKFICENALNFVIPENTAVFFFFNPFSANIMELVKNKITTYAASTKTEIFIVYVNPKYKEVWINSGYDIYHKEGNSCYTEALIFRKKAD